TMEATDVQPSRLTRAKQKIRDLLKLRKGAATGLIVYSGSAHLVMPPTRDDRIINTMLEDLTPALMPANGDNIEQALQLSRQLFEKSGQPGSLLVIADTVSGTKSLVSQEEDIKLPVQFLAVQPPSADINKGLQKAASKLGAKIIRMRVDAIDVETIAKNAANDFTSAGISDQGERWHDSGYAFLPIIALCILVWFRKGWVLS
ncbi:MAG: VWA domain-containing protein, partial [Thermodesulfobacteriota bacterium]